MNLTPEFHSLIEKIYKEATPYKNLAQIHTGLMGFVYDKIGHYVSESPKETEKTADNPNRSLDNKLEFISNGLIDRYQLRWGEKSIKLFKRKYQHPQLTNNSWVSKETWNRYCQPKVLIRGVARRLIAAYDSVGRAFSVEVIGVISEKISPTTQLALLNSILFNWLHLVEYQLGQIPRGSLSYPKPFVENLPIRQEKWFDQLATELVPQLESLSPKSHEFHEIQTQINLAVFRLYGLSEENQKQIYTFLDTFSLDKIY